MRPAAKAAVMAAALAAHGTPLVVSRHPTTHDGRNHRTEKDPAARDKRARRAARRLADVTLRTVST